MSRQMTMQCGCVNLIDVTSEPRKARHYAGVVNGCPCYDALRVWHLSRVFESHWCRSFCDFCLARPNSSEHSAFCLRCRALARPSPPLHPLGLCPITLTLKLCNLHSYASTLTSPQLFKLVNPYNTPSELCNQLPDSSSSSASGRPKRTSPADGHR
jgi:hypothetical protein